MAAQRLAAGAAALLLLPAWQAAAQTLVTGLAAITGAQPVTPPTSLTGPLAGPRPQRAAARVDPKKEEAAAERRHAAAPKEAAATAPRAPGRTTAMARPPSYTVTTRRGAVTYTTTRIVPLPGRPPPAMAAATPAATAPARAAAPARTAPATRTAASPPAPPPRVATATPPAATPSNTAARVQTASLVPPKPAVAAPAALPPPPPGAASAFVSSFLADAFRIARADGTNSLQRRAQLANLFGSKLDVSRIAGFTTGNELASAPPEIQRRFPSVLVSYLVETYYPRIELASDPSVTVETSAAEPLPDGTAAVWTTFTKPGFGSQSVKWQLIATDGGFKIVDIFSTGASVMQMERDTFLSVMRSGGLPELMAKLDARTKELASAGP